ncbi:MAG: carboxypeptidase regulatory-like domain-containing protein [Terriglobia bacterium]
MYRSVFALVAALALASALAAATSTAALNGVVHDPQHRPIPEARVTLRAANSSLVRTAVTNENGEFKFSSIPAGHYVIQSQAPGFSPLAENIQVKETKNPVLHLWMKVAGVRQQVNVSGAPALLNAQTSTVQTMVTGTQIAQTPGADLTNSLSMITNFVPGAYTVHDMLHVRGGHQENWFFDGIPVINTNIASNVGPVIDPKNIQSLQVQTGGYSSEYGDRAYGFFNVVTPSGFNRNSQGELVTSYGSFNRTDDLLSFGSHTDRFAYYASVNGNRSDLGLSTPTPEIIHDQESGLGGFASVLYNASPENQIRFIAAFRGDHYQVPNTPEQQARGIRDLDVERNDMAGFTWAHSTPGGVVLTVSPFFHFNRADYAGGPGDRPFILNDNRRSSYEGALASLAVPAGKNKFRTALEVWGQHDNTAFGLSANPGSQILAESFRPWASSEALSFGDRYQVASWFSLNGGIRLSHYGGLVSENAADSRAGGALRVPRVHWILHGYYAQYYQPPPLDTISGPLASFVLQQGFSFTPLHGDRDHQWDTGISIPVRHWFLNFDHFRTDAANFLDHDEIGNSDIFLPLADQAALIRGNEVTLRSPEILGRARLNIVYSNQIAEGLGPITGGLIEFAPASYFLLDHDQRNTASAVLNVRLPGRAWAGLTDGYGSGFLDGNGPSHLPPHSTWSLALGKALNENISVSVNALNLTNSRFMLDNSNTFGGSHFVDPRELYVELRWRFHY